MRNAITFVHAILRDTVKAGDVVIDATVGNGHDTQLLADLVQHNGLVYGFDVQQEAIDAARSLLGGSSERLRLTCAGHETIATAIDPAHRGRVKAVTFNLGYLPGGDKTITTNAETTLPAIEQAIGMLSPDGIITIVCYQHPEGLREINAVRNLLQQMPQPQFSCLETNFVNQRGNPAVVFIVYMRHQQTDLP